MRQIPRKTKSEREQAHLESGKLIALELLLASKQAPQHHRNQLTALSGRIQLCNQHSNVFVIKNAFTNAQQQPTDAIDRLWRCNSKLCPSCLARQALKSRRKLREALAKQKPLRGERYYFITYTIPNTDQPLVLTRSIVQYAWSLFRKRSLCVSLLRGGVKTEEFTVTANGIHYHLHSIVLCRWFLYEELRRVWTDCVKESFKEHELEHLWNEYEQRRLKQWNEYYADNPEKLAHPNLNLQVKIKPVTPTERSVQELCKYVTKADSWTKMRKTDLTEVAMISRWHRMFELFGSFSNRPGRANGTALAIVHTEPLTDGLAVARPQYWRTVVEEMDVEVYLINLEDKIQQQKERRWRDLIRKYPNHTITTLDYELGLRVEAFSEYGF